VALYGTTAIAALGIGNRLGGGTIMGQNLGAENVGRIERTVRAASLIGGATLTVCMGLGIVFPEPLLQLFVDSSEKVTVGVPMIRILGSSFIVASYAIALACAFTDSDHNLPLLIFSATGRWKKERFSRG
jgi:Na+-driven multidrug efflux pump